MLWALVLPLVFLALVTQVSSNAKGAQMSVTGKTWETASFTCDLTQEATYIHLYKQQEGMAPRRLFYYDVYYSKIQFESGTNKEKYSVYKVTGRSYRFAILNLEDSDSGVYYCAVWDKHIGSDFLYTALEILLVAAKCSSDRDLDIDMSPKPTMFLPSITEIKRENTGTYLCLLENFFPHVIKVYWREKGGNRVLPSQQGNTVKTADTYMKFSWVTVSGNSMNKEHMCIVKHEKNKRGDNQEILFPPVNEVVSSVVTATKPPNDGLKDKKKQVPVVNSTKACLKDENNTLQLHLMNTSAYYTYLLLLITSTVYLVIITSCVFRRTGVCGIQKSS